MSSTMELTTRNAELGELVTMLRDQQARQVDVVAPATAVRSEAGALLLPGTEEAVLTPDGVSLPAYRPTEVCDQQIADKLGIPTAYLRRMRREHVELYDTNVNGWLSRSDRRFLVRTLRGQSGGGVARALLSDSFRIIDNLDVLLAALSGVRQAGAPVAIDGCDLTERRMYVWSASRSAPWPRPCCAVTAARSPAPPGRITRSCSPGSSSATAKPVAGRSPSLPASSSRCAATA
jgi:hypothetical protein